VARIYAGILGPLAMLTAMLRGVLTGGQIESVMFTAFVSLWVFAVAGYIIGWIAEQTIEQAVHDRITRDLGDRETSDSQPSIEAAATTRPTAPPA